MEAQNKNTSVDKCVYKLIYVHVEVKVKTIYIYTCIYIYLDVCIHPHSVYRIDNT